MPSAEYQAWIDRMSQRQAWSDLPEDHPGKAPTIHQYRRDRRAAILSDNDQDIITYLDKYGISIRESIAHYRHSMRVNLPGIPADIRARSLEWLRKNPNG
jgi:hypothetical protein